MLSFFYGCFFMANEEFKSVQALLDRARIPLNDDEKVRYTDDELLRYFIEAMQLVMRKRPDLFIGSWQFVPSAMIVTDHVPIHEMYWQVLADYVTGRAESVDADMSAESRAMLFMNLSNAGA